MPTNLCEEAVHQLPGLWTCQLTAEERPGGVEWDRILAQSLEDISETAEPKKQPPTLALLERLLHVARCLKSKDEGKIREDTEDGAHIDGK